MVHLQWTYSGFPGKALPLEQSAATVIGVLMVNININIKGWPTGMDLASLQISGKDYIQSLKFYCILFYSILVKIRWGRLNCIACQFLWYKYSFYS